MSASWPDVERTLCRIPQVLQARVLPGVDDRVRELHVVAAPGRPSTQLVDDVRSVALALGVDVARDAVSVVQLDDADQGGGAAAAPAPLPRRSGRTLLRGMVLDSAGGRLSVSVVLEHAGRDVRGSSGPPAGVASLPRLTAMATLDALAQLHPTAQAEVADVEVRQLSAGRVAVVAVTALGGRGEDVLVGTAAVRSAGEPDAVARAVLDAVNRRLPH